MLRRCGTHTKFRNLMRWLTKNKYIIKMGGTGTRAPYRANHEKVKYLPNGEITIKVKMGVLELISRFSWESSFREDNSKHGEKHK